MNIVHVCVNGPYTNNWGYQENLMPKYHKKFGNNVTVIASNKKYSNTSELIIVPCADYYLNDGVRVIRLQQDKLFNEVISSSLVYYKIYDLLWELKPDFIMVHGLGSISALQVAKYVKRINKKCIVVADSHTDQHNIKINGGIKFTLYKLILRLINKHMQKYYKKIYGITPSCEKIATEFYGIHKEKIELLPLGCDTDLVDFENKNNIKKHIRYKYNIGENDILIVTGGKLDEKKNTHSLMKAISKIEHQNIKLIVFGNPITDEYGNILKSIEKISENKIKLIGMLSLKQIYDLYLASDLAVFPGSQSALWQQAIASGLPVVIKKWPLIDYLDLGGNIKMLERTDEFAIKDLIEELVKDSSDLSDMKRVAMTSGIDFFSYEKIAKRVLECD